MHGAEVFWKMGKFLLKFRGGAGIMSKSYAGVLELVDEVDSKSTASFPVAPALSLAAQGFLTTQYVRWISCPSHVPLWPDFWAGFLLFCGNFRRDIGGPCLKPQ